MHSKRFLILFIACVLAAGVAWADWTGPEANLAAYEKEYGEASEAYKLIKYGAESEAVGKIKEILSDLGYFGNRLSNNYYRTLETAVRVFAGQLRIGGDGSEITPLMQAMLADPGNMPRAISPAIDVYAYSWEPTGNTYDAYTYSRITRKGVQEDAMVGFSGRIAFSTSDGGVHYYAVEMEEDAEKLVYVSYAPLPRTTVFQTGDSVAVFGVTKGLQSLSYEGMEEEVLLVTADRVGYSP